MKLSRASTRQADDLRTLAAHLARHVDQLAREVAHAGKLSDTGERLDRGGEGANALDVERRIRFVLIRPATW